MQKVPKPRNIRLRVLDHKWLSHKVVNVHFEVVEPADFDFLPGQHVSLIVGDKLARPYSIFSDLSDKKHFAITVSSGHKGIGADFLKNLKPGEEVVGLGPLGRFWVRGEHKPNIFFYASGTGISPIYTILNQMKREKVKSRIRLIWGLRSEDDIILTDVLNTFKDGLDFDYDIYLSKPPERWNGKTGYVTKDLKFVEDTQYYVFGVMEMVSAVKKLLEDLGVKQEDVIG